MLEEEFNFCADPSVDEFENLNAPCSQYLQDFNATTDMKATYWLGLLALSIGFRIIGAYFLRRNSYTNG